MLRAASLAPFPTSAMFVQKTINCNQSKDPQLPLVLEPTAPRTVSTATKPTSAKPAARALNSLPAACAHQANNQPQLIPKYVFCKPETSQQETKPTETSQTVLCLAALSA